MAEREEKDWPEPGRVTECTSGSTAITPAHHDFAIECTTLLANYKVQQQNMTQQPAAAVARGPRQEYLTADAVTRQHMQTLQLQGHQHIYCSTG